MTNSTWQKQLSLFEENRDRILKMDAFEPMPNAKWCRESPHHTLGHIVSCQAAWMPLMVQLHAGETTGSISINPDPLFTKLQLATTPWEELVNRLVSERMEWRKILEDIDVEQEIKTTKRIWTAQLLTRRLVKHEKRHLDDLQDTE